MSEPHRTELELLEARSPLFVERETYKRRRLRDAARALPALGGLLWMVPLLWPNTTEPMPASNALIYLFAVWIGLILISGGLVRALNRGDRLAEQADRTAGDTGL